MTQPLDLLDTLLSKAKAKGADAADAVYVSGQSLSLSQRLGEPEDLDRSEGRDAGLRVFIGKRQAIVSSSDTGTGALDELVERALAMAKAVPEDEFAGVADPDQLAADIPDVDGFDGFEPSAEKLIELAGVTEDAARGIEGVTNSEGAEASWGTTEIAIAASNGFAERRRGSRFSVSVSVLAGEGTGMERDYDYDSKVFFEDLQDAAAIGASAGRKAVERLNPRKVETRQAPVVYDPRVAGSIVRHLAGAVNGASVARGTSFLKDKMGERVFPEGVTIIDDPLMPRGLNSKPFDGEGLATRRHNVVDKGRLTTWFLNLRSARQLGLAPTGHASRGVSSPPGSGSTNLYLAAGDISRGDMIRQIDNGFYVTELIGMGLNGVTGDYSRGATGFWIENGEIAYPVSEMTIAGNLKDMFMNLTPADDLEFRYGVNAPTVRIDGMTVAGK